MKVIVKYTGLFCTTTGKKNEIIEVEAGKTLNHLIDIVGSTYDIQPLLEQGTLFLINDKIAQKEQALSEGDEIHIFQMMAGG